MPTTTFKKKKRPRNDVAKLLKKTSDDEIEDGANDTRDSTGKDSSETESTQQIASTADLIARSKKKRKVLERSKRSGTGVGDKLLLKSNFNLEETGKNETNAAQGAIGNKELGERLKGSFAGAGSEGRGAESVIQSKHEAAMNSFVMEGMEKAGVMAKKMEKQKEVSGVEKETRELYRSLDPRKNDGDGISPVPEARDDDKGAGGTMLGGTGIAEVILPTSIRLQNARETVEATNEKEKIGFMGKRDTTVAGSFSHNFKKNSHEWYKNMVKTKERDDAQRKKQGQESEEECEKDSSRPGFKSLDERKKEERIGEGAGKRSKDSFTNRKNRNNDDKKYRDFMNKARNSRM